MHSDPQRWTAEEHGVRYRMDHFYTPMFRQFVDEQSLDDSQVAVLDCGCGTGLSLNCLAEQGWTACGIDLWFEREQQWRERRRPEHAHVLKADATKLPFADRSFDIVFSCGLLEHIGVDEEWEPVYRVSARPDQFEQRKRFFEECFRVLRRPGVIFVDHPNGAFPIDFWHDDQQSMRPHGVAEKFLPKFGEIEQLVRAAGCDSPVRAVSPAGRFTFDQVREHWWGRLLERPFEAWFRLMGVRPFTRLARSGLNPYLVTRIALP